MPLTSNVAEVADTPGCLRQATSPRLLHVLAARVFGASMKDGPRPRRQRTPAEDGDRVKRYLDHPELGWPPPISHHERTDPMTDRPDRPAPKQRKTRGPCRNCGATADECAVEAARHAATCARIRTR